MKAMYLCFMFMFTVLSVNAQNEFSDTISVYSMSLKEHVNYLVNHDNKNSQQIKVFYIQAAEYISEKLPLELYGYKIIFLNQKQIREKAKKILPLVVIRPIEFHKDGFTIEIIDFIVMYKNRNFNYSNSGGTQLKFKYDCEKGRFVLYDKQQGVI